MTMKDKLILWWFCFHHRWLHCFPRDIYIGWLGYRTARLNTRTHVAKLRGAYYTYKLAKIEQRINCIK